ncbi:hypothetical protein [Actinophytocola sediminis]
MRSAENVLWRLEDRRYLAGAPAQRAPKSFSSKPVAFAPHPPLVSGGWYTSAARELAGPGRYPVPRPPAKTAGAALRWTLLFGPLGLGYLSPTAGSLATALTLGLLAVTGSVTVLAVIWPVAMLLSLLYATNGR